MQTFDQIDNIILKVKILNLGQKDFYFLDNLCQLFFAPLKKIIAAFLRNWSLFKMAIFDVGDDKRYT